MVQDDVLSREGEPEVEARGVDSKCGVVAAPYPDMVATRKVTGGLLSAPKQGNACKAESWELRAEVTFIRIENMTPRYLITAS